MICHPFTALILLIFLISLFATLPATAADSDGRMRLQGDGENMLQFASSTRHIENRRTSGGFDKSRRKKRCRTKARELCQKCQRNVAGKWRSGRCKKARKCEKKLKSCLQRKQRRYEDEGCDGKLKQALRKQGLDCSLPEEINNLFLDGDGESPDESQEESPEQTAPEKEQNETHSPPDDTRLKPFCSWSKLHAQERRFDQHFGSSVAIDGSVIVVGAPGRCMSEGCNSKGEVYVFAWNGTDWADKATLLPPSLAEGPNGFGTSVAIEGDLIVVGARGSSGMASNKDVGSVYVFKEAKGGGALPSWDLEATLMPPDGNSGDFFGNKVAVSESTIIVGAPRHDVYNTEPESFQESGAAYVYSQDSPSTWVLQKKLSKRYHVELADRLRFGSGVAIEKDKILVSSNGPAPTCGGAFHSFRLNDDWELISDVETQEGSSDKHAFCGTDIASSNGLAIYGPGGAFVYTQQDDGSYIFDAELISDDANELLTFGNSVAISNYEGSKYAIVGAPRDPGGDRGDRGGSGIAYIFALTKEPAGGWKQIRKLVPDDNAPGDGFGFGVAIQGDTAVVGAWLDDSGTGSAYVISAC